MEITVFLLENNYCVFKEEFYQQTFGYAMGSKLSPILAQYVKDHLLQFCRNKLLFKVPFLNKFLDDILTAVPKEETQTIINCFNCNCKNLQFTLEIENFDQSVPFLDTKS